MSDNPVYIDGYYGTPRLVSRTPREYPFAANGDNTSAFYAGTYLVDQARFVPTPRGTEDPLNPGFYLLEETKPDIAQGDIAPFVRTYGNIPLQQIVPGSMFITKPSLPGAFPQVLGASLVMQPDSTSAIYRFYTRKFITSDSGAPNGSYPTGSTYTVTVGANTTGGIAFGANAATLAAAINALASISNRGSVTVTGTYNSAAGFTITRAAYAAGSLTIAGLTGTFTQTTSVTPGNNGQFSWFQIGNAATGGTITGGTFTITVFGQTTGALAFNCTAADVKTALEALSNVGVGGVDSVTPPGDGGWGPNLLSSNSRSIKFGVFFNVPLISTNGAALTPAGSNSAVSMAGTYAGNFQASPTYWTLFGLATLTFSGSAAPTRVFFSAAHGISNSDSIYVKVGAVYYTLASGTFTVTSADTIQVTASAGAIFSDAGVATEMGKFSNTYAAGSTLARIKRVTDFYLPGITAGITTLDDIPLPAWQGDPASMIAAIFAGSTSINYEVGELSYWKGPILQRTVTTINAAKI